MKKGAPKKTFSEMAIVVCYGVGSLILIIFGACFQKEQVISTILVGVGCSGIAAALMSFALLIRDNNAKKEQIERDRRIFFQGIHSELKYILQKILWYDDRIDDDSFDWSLPDEQYATFRYMLFAHEKYKDSPKLSCDEAKSRLEVITKKYNLDAQRTFDKNMQKKTEKMFRIIYCNSLELSRSLLQLTENKLMLNQIGYISLEEVESLENNVNMAQYIMLHPQKNYGVAVKLLLIAYEKILEIGNYSNEMTISLQGFYRIPE